MYMPKCLSLMSYSHHQNKVMLAKLVTVIPYTTRSLTLVVIIIHLGGPFCHLRVLQTAFVPASLGGFLQVFLQVDSSACRSVGPAGGQWFLQEGTRRQKESRKSNN